MVIPRKEDISGLVGIPKGSIKDTKRAVVFATLGLPLDPVTGIFVMRKAGVDRLDGDAYFTFNVPLETFERLNLIYDAGTADVEFDQVLEEIKADPLFAAVARRLEILVVDALLVYGRRFLENYQRMLHCLRQRAPDIEIKEKVGAFEFTFFGRKN